MNTVTRRTLWFHAADSPYVDFCFKGTQFFFNFKKSLRVCYPDGKKPALWPGGPEAAREDGINLRVPSWSWWIVADDTVELSCSHHGILGDFLSYCDDERGTEIGIPITVAEGKALRRAVEEMIGEAEAAGESFRRNPDLHVLRPNKKAIAYPVSVWEWVSPRRRTKHNDHGHVWNPRGMV